MTEKSKQIVDVLWSPFENNLNAFFAFSKQMENVMKSQLFEQWNAALQPFHPINANLDSPSLEPVLQQWQKVNEQLQKLSMMPNKANELLQQQTEAIAEKLKQQREDIEKQIHAYVNEMKDVQRKWLESLFFSPSILS
jgi:chromosome segregation ATPase